MNTYIVSKGPSHLFSITHIQNDLSHIAISNLTATQARAVIDSLTALADDLTASSDSGCIVQISDQGEVGDYWDAREGYVGASGPFFDSVHGKPFVIDTTNQDGYY